MKCMFLYSVQSITQIACLVGVLPPLVLSSGLQYSTGCELVGNELFLGGSDHFDGDDACLEVKWGYLAQASVVIGVVFFTHETYQQSDACFWVV